MTDYKLINYRKRNILDFNPGWEQFKKYYSPISEIKEHLTRLSKKYGLGEVTYKPADKKDWDSVSSFYIEAPEKWDYDKVSKVWDQIVDKTVLWASKEGILASLNTLTIIVKAES